MQKKKMMKTIFWVKDVDDLLRGSEKVAGIQVQIAFWAKTFFKNGHEVFCLTDKDNSIIDGLKFVHSVIPNVLVRLHLSLLGELIEDLRILIKLNPDFVFVRGAGRYMFILSIICKVLGIKIVFFGASDDEVPGDGQRGVEGRITEVKVRKLHMGWVVFIDARIP